MSKATIILTDDDGAVDVRIEFDPPVSTADSCSEAQTVALAMVTSQATPKELDAAKVIE